jgi:hypothetical protein
MPAALNRVVFLGILFAVYRTKFDYVYLVWFFIINDAPGRLFSSGDFEVEARIPMYPLASGVSIGFTDLFILLYIMKMIQIRHKPKFIFRKEFLFFFFYGFFVISYSTVFGISFDNIIRTFRALLPWAFIFIIPTYIYNRDLMVRSTKLVIPFVILNFGTQVFSFITGKYLDHYLRAVDFSYDLKISSEKISRGYSSVYLTLFSIFQCFYFYYNGKNEINPRYLRVIIFLGFLSIFITGTRGWIVALFLLILGIIVLFGFSSTVSRWFKLIAVSVLMISILVITFPGLQTQIIHTYERLTTLKSLAAGDLSAEGTLLRLNVRAPRVLSKFWESPIIGFGFSDNYYEFSDGHVGHHNILLNIGIIGYILVNGFFVFICAKIYKIAKSLKLQNTKGNASLIYILGLMTVFVIHSSSTQFWGYELAFDQMIKIIFLSLLFSSINIVLRFEK